WRSLGGVFPWWREWSRAAESERRQVLARRRSCWTAGFQRACYFGGCCSPGEPLNSLTRLPSATFHTFTSPFQLPDARRLPSGLAATVYTQSVWPLSVLTAPPSRFHRRTVVSALHVASSGCLPTGTTLKISLP